MEDKKPIREYESGLVRISFNEQTVAIRKTWYGGLSQKVVIMEPAAALAMVGFEYHFQKCIKKVGKLTNFKEKMKDALTGFEFPYSNLAHGLKLMAVVAIGKRKEGGDGRLFANVILRDVRYTEKIKISLTTFEFAWLIEKIREMSELWSEIVYSKNHKTMEELRDDYERCGLCRATMFGPSRVSCCGFAHRSLRLHFLCSGV